MDAHVWWTTCDECRVIGECLPAPFPNALRDEFRSRYGRNGRGRLWIPDGIFPDARVPEPWPMTPLARHIELNCGGLVFDAELDDLFHVMPGFVTDLQLRRVML